MRTELQNRSMQHLRSTIERYGYVFAVICIVAATGVFFVGRDYFAKGQWALLYLLIIGLVAGLSGVRPALLASVLAFLAWNYFFLPPFHTFVVADPKDWISLIAFLAVSIAMGLQTGRMREREAEALAREREMALLNQFSAHLVSETTIEDMAELLISEVKRSASASCVMLFLPDEERRLRDVHLSPDTCEPDSSILDAVEWARTESKAIGLPVHSTRSTTDTSGWPISVSRQVAGLDAGRHDLVIPLQTVTRQEGVLYIGERSDGKSYAVRDAQLLIAVANQAAAFLERKSLHRIAVQADALREADKIKSTLLSSVSHELKTPLASVTATVSNLLESDVEWDAANARAELEAVQDDLARLNSSISGLLDLSRLEAASWEPNKEWYEFGEILGTAVSKISQKQRARVLFELPDDLPMIHVDFPQWARVFQNLLENALSYSSEGSPVRVGAAADAADVSMWVEDEGPGIPAEERERVFDKFYRGKAAERAPSGTGLGLAVTREIVRFHGGEIRVEDAAGHGARLVISMPRESVA